MTLPDLVFDFDQAEQTISSGADEESVLDAIKAAFTAEGTNWTIVHDDATPGARVLVVKPTLAALSAARILFWAGASPHASALAHSTAASATSVYACVSPNVNQDAPDQAATAGPVWNGGGDRTTLLTLVYNNSRASNRCWLITSPETVSLHFSDTLDAADCTLWHGGAIFVPLEAALGDSADSDGHSRLWGCASPGTSALSSTAWRQENQQASGFLNGYTTTTVPKTCAILPGETTPRLLTRVVSVINSLGDNQTYWSTPGGQDVHIPVDLHDHSSPYNHIARFRQVYMGRGLHGVKKAVSSTDRYVMMGCSRFTAGHGVVFKTA